MPLVHGHQYSAVVVGRGGADLQGKDIAQCAFGEYAYLGGGGGVGSHLSAP